MAAVAVAARRLEFGGVTVNEAPSWRVDHMPYGGIKSRATRAKGRGPPSASSPESGSS